ncbi:Holliday junction ATP-dependent DNA helicase RuvA [Methylacidimicrobium cyclopophantes]|uniref:Holliday junction branch migration complex subunit RuvA n=1 Tax=Methylacidimicrobium cyclopophantes TaxID=1041766 RepID=A0A5E6M8B9_9BACT|nr:Holliday junction branch migration protein RuvA [Methylacidimicrobium cyclopophantes]VVM04586.1 Holliday junction ATP-dependent DNA helicase RuvA [Methylacidimicrobium cyclopophantes]
MIGYLRGRLVRSSPTQVCLEVQGLGFELFVPLSSYQRLPSPPAEVQLYTRLQAHEKGIELYGFAEEEERTLFSLLVDHVPGIGPRTALSVLGAASPEELRSAVRRGDQAWLSRIKGVGKKTAERLIVELRDRFPEVEGPLGAAGEPPGDDPVGKDARLALLALGYREAEAEKAIRSARERLPKAGVEELIREALRGSGGKGTASR